MTRPSQLQRALALACEGLTDALLEASARDQGCVDASKVPGELSALEEAWVIYQLVADSQGRSAALTTYRDVLAHGLSDVEEPSP